MIEEDDSMIFKDEIAETETPATEGKWRVLIVDDEPEVHEVTAMALKGVSFDGLGLEILSAFSGKETIRLLESERKIALIILDIVMEDEDSGLQVVKHVREVLKDKFVRIVLRTGQPGHAPEREIILTYDINDYKEKNELTSNKLFSSVISAIRSYKDILFIHETALAQEHIKKELSIARDIQEMSMPNTFPLFPKRNDIDVYCKMTPAYEVGGDFYDVFLVGENRLCVFLGDVSGKGIGSALYTMTCKTLIRNEAQRQQDPLLVLHNVNNFLCSLERNGLFVTLFLGFIEVSTGIMDYSNAGHLPPLVVSERGLVRILDLPEGVPLNFFQNEQFERKQVTLPPDSYILAFTDGVTDAINAEEMMFRSELLHESIRDNSFPSAKHLIEHVSNRINEFVGEAQQTDDIALVALRVGKDSASDPLSGIIRGTLFG